jgi:hypothetical protein
MLRSSTGAGARCPRDAHAASRPAATTHVTTERQLRISCITFSSF